MKIALITETFLPSTDGVAIRLSYAVDEMLRQGNEVIIICPAVDGVKNYYKTAKIYPMFAANFFFYDQRKWGTPNKQVKNILQDFKPDIVHSANPISLAASGVHYAKKLGIPLVCSYHTNVPDCLEHYGFGFFKPLVWNYIRDLHNSAQINLVTSQATYDLLQKQGIHGLRVLPKAVDARTRSPKFYSKEMRERLSDGEVDKTLLIYIGRLAPEKEVQSLRALLDKRDDIRLAIVGDGPCKQELENIFKGTKTVFTGFLKGQELSEAYASGDIFIFTSQRETLGLVLTESMASGTPVIAVESEPTFEQIKHDQNGLIYKKGNIDELSFYIDLLKDKYIYANIQKNGIEYARQFSWERSSQTIIQAYEDTLLVQNTKLA